MKSGLCKGLDHHVKVKFKNSTVGVIGKHHHEEEEQEEDQIIGEKDQIDRKLDIHPKKDEIFDS